MVEEEKPAEAEEHLKALRRIFRPKKPEGSKPAEKKKRPRSKEPGAT